MSTKREALNALLLTVDELSDEQRTEMGVLTTQDAGQLEVEARAAILAEDVPTITTTTVTDGEDRELRSLIDRANVGEIFRGRSRAHRHHRSDRKRSFKTHYRLAANAIPLALA